MPKDGSFQPDPDAILTTLIAARAKFTGPESWFKLGNEPIEPDEGPSHCIGTALGSMWHTPAAKFLLKLAGAEDTSLAMWNNAPNYRFPNEHRTYEDVIELLDRAITARRRLAIELVA